MVARSPAKHQQKMAPPILRETVNKVDRCMARLQELQHTVTGQTSLLCKRDSLRLIAANSPGKLPVSREEWREMSLPAMLLGETVGEILRASEFATSAVEAAVVSSKNKKPDDPKTPSTKQRPPTMEHSGLHARRRKEKEIVKRSENNGCRAKSKINFEVPPDKENCRYRANRVSPRNRPWVKKTVLFPNPLFHSSPTSHRHNSPRPRNRQMDTTTPHKFLIKSHPRTKFQVKIRSPPVSVSPTKKSGRASAAARLRRSFSPSRLASKLVSPLKSRKFMAMQQQKSIEEMKIMTGLKQRPASASFQ